ncbi:MAG: hypothetical protein HYV93_15600 [Candidatus Rokubacteria bacterium]|nr:hypothetical protein [Candidatus Rokubacteria bacterium]
MRSLMLLLLALLCVTGTACSRATMVETRWDGRTGQTTTRRFSMYFEAAAEIVPGTVGAHLIVDLEKREVPILYDLQQALGLLGPGDLEAGGLFTMYLFNLTDRPQEVEITSATRWGRPVLAAPVTVALVPRDWKRRVVLGRTVIGSYDTREELDLTVTVAGRRYTTRLVAERQTFDALERKYGRGGTGPDLPWLKPRS